jgi:hypothetical protein
MENEKDVTTRQIMALLIYTLATGPATEARLKPLVDQLGFDWNVLANWAKRSGTGPLGGQRGIIQK